MSFSQSTFLVQNPENGAEMKQNGPAGMSTGPCAFERVDQNDQNWKRAPIWICLGLYTKLLFALLGTPKDLLKLMQELVVGTPGHRLLCVTTKVVLFTLGLEILYPEVLTPVTFWWFAMLKKSPDNSNL